MLAVRENPLMLQTPRLEPRVVTQQAELAALAADLAARPAIAVDTESNSLYVYRERVCLIQFSTPAADTIVDALCDLDLTPLGAVFADAGVQKVFHAAEYDVMCLKRDYGFTFANLFDTMLAARVLGWRRIGLGDALSEQFGVYTDKRYQRYDWGQRPLPAEALHYAGLDTHYLLPLRDAQLELLAQHGRQEETADLFAQVAATAASAERAFEPQDFWRVKGAYDLNGNEQAVLRELAVWRDSEAQRLNRPTFKVLGDQTLVALAQARPHAMAELGRLPGFKSHHAQRYGERILRAIRQGEQAGAPAPPPRPSRRPRAVLERFQLLRDWRSQVATERGVESDVVLGNGALWALAERNPQTPPELERISELGPWRRQAYGAAILEVLRPGPQPRKRRR
jgi:ribonuclease D